MFFFITKIDENNNLTRYELYKNAAEMPKTFLNFKNGKDPYFIFSIYRDSATILFDMEKYLVEKREKANAALFINLYSDNRKRLINDSFKEYVDSTLSSDIFHNRNKKSFRYLFNLLLRTIIDYQNLTISGFLDTNETINSAIKERLDSFNKVFLSYAMDDLGLTLALFYYFYKNKIYLYVNWMHSPALPTGKDIKKTIRSELLSSKQLLFLRTSNSELSLRGGNLIKQWCAWEIGNYYAINKKEKYYLNFYETSSAVKNKLLDSLKPMKGIKDGKIISY